MARTQDSWTPLPDGRYRSNSTGQVVNPASYSKLELQMMGLPTTTNKESPVATTVSKDISDYRRPYAPTDRGKVLAESVGDQPLGYEGMFQEAFEDLGQPGKVGQNFVVSGTQELAESFVDRFFEKTGKLPYVKQVNEFVANNLTSSFA